MVQGDSVVGDFASAKAPQAVSGCCHTCEWLVIDNALLDAVVQDKRHRGVAMAGCGNKDFGFPVVARQGLNASFCGPVLC